MFYIIKVILLVLLVCLCTVLQGCFYCASQALFHRRIVHRLARCSRACASAHISVLVKISAVIAEVKVVAIRPLLVAIACILVQWFQANIGCMLLQPLQTLWMTGQAVHRDVEGTVLVVLAPWIVSFGRATRRDIERLIVLLLAKGLLIKGSQSIEFRPCRVPEVRDFAFLARLDCVVDFLGNIDATVAISMLSACWQPTHDAIDIPLD